MDSSAAKAVSGRVGVGKRETRDIDVRYLWVHQAVRRRIIDLKKPRGDRNPADVLTKPKGLPDIKKLLKPVNVVLQETWQQRRGMRLPGGVNHHKYYARHTLCSVCMERACVVFALAHSDPATPPVVPIKQKSPLRSRYRRYMSGNMDKCALASR